MKDFNTLLEQYADVSIKIGLDMQAGQRLIITATPEAKELTYAVVRSAYRNGALDVYVIWRDDMLNKIRLEEGSEDALAAYPQWVIDGYVHHMDDGHAIMSIGPWDPDMLHGQDPGRMKIFSMATAKSRAPIGTRIGKNATNWLGINAPHPKITAKMFPELSPEEGRKKHWEAIFKACRIHEDDPIAAWATHNANLKQRATHLTDKQFTALHYQADGTDLTVGLPKGHIWVGGDEEMKNGTSPVANIPTEEVFTLAHTAHIDGIVKSTKPLPFQGTIIENFTLQFSEGRVVDASAERGQDALDMLLNTDEGARSIGELALVPHSSPISQSGLTFYSVLYDENASCHIALGSAYRSNLENGTEMTDEEFAEAGGNDSLIHVDFMIGSETMNIDGIHADGSREPVMRNGEWAGEFV